jgi:hypothetical protein
MEAQQAKHDADVASGKKRIDDAFAQFDERYFDNYKRSYLDVYNAQLTDQYDIAKDKLVGTLAGSWIAASARIAGRVIWREALPCR